MRGRRSRRLSVESYFHAEKSVSSRSHSLSPSPGQQPHRPLARETSGGTVESSSPPRQRAHAMIYKYDEEQQLHLSQHQNQHQSQSHERERTRVVNDDLVPSHQRQRAGAVESNLPPKAQQNPSTPRSNGGVESDFLMKYKPDTENKVHFTMRELLALRLLFSLFDRSLSLDLSPSISLSPSLSLSLS
jgi:hypothetical protein